MKSVTHLNRKYSHKDLVMTEPRMVGTNGCIKINSKSFFLVSIRGKPLLTVSIKQPVIRWVQNWKILELGKDKSRSIFWGETG